MKKTILIFPLFFMFIACGDRRLGGRASGGEDAANQSTNYIALHTASSSQYRGDCLSCHSDILEEESLNSDIPSAHQAMMDETPGETTQAKCVYCHASTDIFQHSAGNIRKNVSSETCDVCHGPSGPGGQYFQK